MKTMTLVDPPTGQVTLVGDGRKTMRTLADALAKLQDLGALARNGQALIRAVPLRLPDGSTAAMVSVSASAGGNSWCIMMPSSTHFTARDTNGASSKHDTVRLDGAITDADVNVQLFDGSYVHAVHLTPARLVERLAPDQVEILRKVIRFLEAEEQCYRPFHEELLPGLMGIDYAAVAKLGTERLPGLKAIERDLIRQGSRVSRQTLANVLALAGLRRPRSGLRARPRPPRSPGVTVLP